MISRSYWSHFYVAAILISLTQIAFAQTSERDSTRIDSSTTIRDSVIVRSDTVSMKKDTLTTSADTVSAPKDTLDIITSAANLNTVPGFRIQILATQSLQDAIDMKAEAQSELDGYNIYLVYDPPFYKVRVGDFKVRYEANKAGNYITSHGYPDAWTVPDNVFRNPATRK